MWNLGAYIIFSFLFSAFLLTLCLTHVDCFGGQTPLMRDLLARKLKRDEDRARKAEEERKRREQEDLLDEQRKVTTTETDCLKP